ncbi:MAG: PilW family protein [Ramlibacter sp.]
MKTLPDRFALGAARQRGLTLIEFMVSIVLGMLMVAALAALIANQSGNRAELDRSGRMIENGRYAIRAMAEDLQLAGYWGELATAPTTPGAMPNPCSLAVADIEAAMALHVQGYDAPATSAVPTCITNQLPGTDILVVRRADPDSSSFDAAPGVPDLAKVTAAAGQVVIQTGINAAANQSFDYKINVANSNSSTTAAMFPLVRKDLTTLATIRKVLVRIYYVSACSVEVASSCTNGDGGNPIPTLKMKELSVSSGAPGWNTITLAEGIENLQVDYGVDTDSDGSPDGADVNGAGLGVADWPNVMAVKIYLVARSTDKSPTAAGSKTFDMGTAGSIGAASDQYRRHAFMQSVRLVNPSARRSS